MSHTQAIAFPMRWFARLALVVPAVRSLVLAEQRPGGAARSAWNRRRLCGPGRQTITNTGPTVINGDLGLHPGTSVTGFPPGTVNGAQHVSDAAAHQARPT